MTTNRFRTDTDPREDLQRVLDELADIKREADRIDAELNDLQPTLTFLGWVAVVGVVMTLAGWIF